MKEETEFFAVYYNQIPIDLALLEMVVPVNDKKENGIKIESDCLKMTTATNLTSLINDLPGLYLK